MNVKRLFKYFPYLSPYAGLVEVIIGVEIAKKIFLSANKFTLFLTYS